MGVIERYLMREIACQAILISGLLVVMFASYSAQRYLTEAANGTLALPVVLAVIFYKIVISLEMLLPVGLYVAAAVVLGRLHTDSEITAFFACGGSPWRVYTAVLFPAVVLALLVSVLSLYGRPRAYNQIYHLQQQSQSALDVSHLQANTFNQNNSGRMVLAAGIDPATRQLTDALIYSRTGNITRLYRAQRVTVTDPSPLRPGVRLQAGTAYRLDRQGRDDNLQHYNVLQMALKPTVIPLRTGQKSATVRQLLDVPVPGNIAELQWRQSRGINTLMMVLLAVPLSRCRPRQGRYAALLPLTLVFIAIFYGGNLCRTLVANNSLPEIPGGWLVTVSIAIVLLMLMFRDFSSLRHRV
ncbi:MULTISPECIES: LPS export ABC transporter permease LptF [unclassified Tatumella]|uniref:LPS export ABC transporter permease LptF n=1 Tax=unclassified Tatumella TaxID=2649542 RepID=UPI001BB0C7D4|nr:MULTISPECIES: LPS export ABC transporter permease LptF [unclassified Tatumella]MBS0878110.1 LPS export ABC transporter permease LptF [Tatumella sp. JGM82]MBS0890469.1 LPS export ABC transporter permease LptF [Tatumella sp. JGM94]MBS0900925.1 LPS export ABC transporter permease LptF [Tatumella sp. JGM100]